MQLFWKRLATSESTNWVFTRADTTYIEGNAFCFSGRIGTGDPFEASSTQTVASGTSLALPSITASTGADLVAIGENFNYTAWTPPSGMTEAHDFGEVTGMAYAANVTAGATGVKTLTAATGAPMKGFLGSILPAGDGRGRSSNFTGAAVVRASRW